MASNAPPSILPTSALGIGIEAFVAARAAVAGGFADARATFEYSLASPGEDYGFMLLAGLEPLLDALERFKVKNDELAWLESVSAIDVATRRRLAEGRFACDVDAAPEGSVVFPDEPLLVVEGPYWQAQLVGGLVESALGEATLAATKIARAVLAADGAAIYESSAANARRLGGAPLIARAAYIAGAYATTSALAGKRYGIPVHAVEPARFARAASHDAALAAWLDASPEGATVRLDPRRPAESIATLVGVLVERERERSWGDARIGIEVPATDAVELARDAVAAFEEAGLREPAVLAAGADERAILELRRTGAPIAGYCVSSHVAADVGALARYALAAIEEDGAWSPRIELASRADRTTDPGRKLLVRYFDADQRPVADVAHLANERLQRPKDGRYVDRASGVATPLAAATSSPLLSGVMRAGKRVAAPESARVIRQRAQKALAALPPRHRRLVRPARFPVGVTSALAALRVELSK